MSRRKRPKGFFSSEEQQAIEQAIGRAETATSGELRVHLEYHCPKDDAYERGKEVFEELGMTATAERNGVLIYLATGDGEFAVLGDKGIDEVVPEGFWDEIVSKMASAFGEDDFVRGMTEGIERIGEKLGEYFPYAGDEADENELPDDLSIRDD